MTSRLEQAIACGVLPESIDVYKEIAFFSIDVVDKRYWLGYVADDSAIIGPHKNQIKIYFETLDEAVDALIPIVWAEIKDIDNDKDSCEKYSYERYCLDLVYEPMVTQIKYESVPHSNTEVLSISEIGIAISVNPEVYDFDERLQRIDYHRVQKIKELCANGDRVPLPVPFDVVEY
jgi:hypothetical protein